MEILINDITIKITFSFRADIIFENITNKTFEGKNETEWITYLYSNIVCKNKDIKFNDFMDWLDENPQELTNFINAYIEKQKQIKLLTSNTEVKEDNKIPSRKNK